MKFLARFSRLGRCRTRLQPRPTAFFRPQLELLEERTLLDASPTTAALQAGYGQLPLAFTVNEGQAAAPINYLAQGSGYSIALTAQQAQLSLGQGSTSTTLNLQLAGANASAQAVGQDELVTKTNYLTGNDPSKWLTNIANYGQVEYRSVYQGVDAVYSGNQGRLETTFLVQPGANANLIQMKVQGAEGLSLDAQGNLVIHTASGDVTELAPVMYQEINGTRQAVSGHYVLEDNNTVGFQVGAYDPSHTLVIDPTLSYSSYLNGAGNGGVGLSIAVDGAGDAYVVGTTSGSYAAGGLGSGAVINKLNAAGTALVYQTYIGGTSIGSGIAVDANGDAYVTGLAGTALPTTANALEPTAPSGLAGFLTVLDPTGANLLYSSYLAGIATSPYGPDVAGPAVAVAGAGGTLDNVYLTGAATTGLPTTPGGYQTSPGGTYNAFLLTINPNLSGAGSLLYGSYLGGSGRSAGTGIAVDGSGNAYVAGATMSSSFPTTPDAFQTTYGSGAWSNVFVAKFDPFQSGTASLVYSTLLGGTEINGFVPWASPIGGAFYEPAKEPAIAVDASGDAYVTGGTDATNFPTTPGAYQTTNPGQDNAFVTKLNPSGSALIYSTYLGTPNNYIGGRLGSTGGNSIAVDSSGNAYVTGWTWSPQFPTVNPVQAQNGGGADAFVTTLNASGSALLFSTYLGGSGDDYGFGIALDSADNIYVTGQTTSTNYPTSPGALQTSASNAFVAKINSPVSQTVFSVTGFPSTITAGVPATITVTAEDLQGNVLTNYTGTVHFTSTDAQAVLPANYTFTAADQGVHTFTVTLKTAGSQSITVTDSTNGGMTGSESSITVAPAAAAQVVLTAPSSVTSGKKFSVTVTIEDAYGNVVTGYVGTIHFSSSNSTATLPANYTFTASDAGVHTFTNAFILKKKGTQSLTATDTQNSALTVTDDIKVS